MLKDFGFKEEISTVWTFPQRGSWSTHNAKYRGNFAPQIARNLILKYSKEGDIVLDPMVGGGTTLIETKLLNRRGIGLDINPGAVSLTKTNLTFSGNYKYEPVVRLGDSRSLAGIENNNVDLIITHPPYLNIIKYSNGQIDGDLSNISGIKKFCDELEKAINEFFRVLKEDRYCAILIGDTRKYQHYVPLAYKVMQRFLKAGFLLKEDIIKIQHNCKSTSYWQEKSKKLKFLMIMHEHLFVFRKPVSNENIRLLDFF